jgi:phosphoribosyl 1,2-cyclic phosphate phosphodiesterase
MKKNYLQILGCGASQGVPTPDGDWGNCKKSKKNIRTRSSLYLSLNNFKILFDTSPDLRFQLLANNITEIDYVFFTHTHADHIFGINELRTFWIKNKKKINIFSTKQCIFFLKKTFNYLFKDNKNYPAILESNVIKNHINIGSGKNKIRIEKLDVEHGSIKTIGYKINNDIVYIPDVKTVPKKTLKKILNIKYLIIDCFRTKEHNLHVSLKETLEYINLIQPKKAFLTHMSKDLDFNNLKKKLKKFKNINVCYDSMKIKI